MDYNMISLDPSVLIDSLTCNTMMNLIKSLNISHFGSRNMTMDEYIKLVYDQQCAPKSYSGVQGVKRWIAFTILMIFLVCGLGGNILSAIIMFRRSQRGLSSYFYLALLAIVDICVLYTGCLLSLLEIGFSYHPELLNKGYCRISTYVKHLFTYISAWLIVAVTLERFIVVRFPFQSMSLIPNSLISL